MTTNNEYETASSSRSAQAFLAENPNAARPSDISIAAGEKKPPQSSENRRAERRLVTGRGRLSGEGISERLGKLIDFSSSGASIWLDDQVPRRPLFFDCDIFQNGKHFIFQIEVVVVYASLTSGKGFKTGLQFSPKPTAAARATIDSLCKALGC